MSEKDILTKKSLDIEDNLAKTEENFIASYTSRSLFRSCSVSTKDIIYS